MFYHDANSLMSLVYLVVLLHHKAMEGLAQAGSREHSLWHQYSTT